MTPSACKQFMRYGLVGGLALGADVGSFLLLRSMAVELVSANVLARLVGAITAHSGNFLWTFEQRPRLHDWLGSLRRYAVLWFGATLLSSLLLNGLTKVGAGETASKLSVELFIMALNFFISRHWVFR